MRRLATVAIAAAAASVGGMAVAAVGDSSPGDGAPAPRAGVASPSEMVFVPITPCRIVNTQNSAGPLQVEEVRQYRMHGDASAQGGAAGCGIPPQANALEMTVTSVSASARGYLRVYPSLVGTPNATFLNYGPGQNLGNTGTVAVQPSAGFNFQVKAFQAGTHVVIDVGGYFIRGLHVSVNPNGSVARGNGIVSSLRSSPGVYRVTFERNVGGCAYNVTIGDPTSAAPATGSQTVSPAADNPNAVVVRTYNEISGVADRPFHLTVTC